MTTWILIVLLPLFSATPEKGEYRKVWTFNTKQECEEKAMWAQKELIIDSAVGRTMCVPSANFPMWR